ncbi:DNA repair protein RecO [Actinomyces vulturis]|uniref:DNA repair protein RecO n=1 Tax=Actinomyces vulturis TaxID=1857645 RepID=UPI00083037D0|nr:DNA repair protein RecO [Actinomyces vulturis]
MASKLYRDEAVVLRTYRLGEADRILVLLTRHHGQVRAVAKGVRKTTSRFGARLEPFSMIDVQLHKGRNLDIVTQVETLDPFARTIGSDYAMYTCASTIAQAAERITELSADIDDESSPQQYLLLIGALTALTRRRHEPGLIMDSYLLRAMALAGWAPSFHSCVMCGVHGPHTRLSMSSGGAVCENCQSAGAHEVGPTVTTLLGALLSGDWAYADASHPRDRLAASHEVSAWVTWHMEKRLSSLRYVERA